MPDMDDIANENRKLEEGMLDPDRHYVRDYLTKALAHFDDCKIHPATVFEALTDAMFRLLPANPNRSPVDVLAMKGDLVLLSPLLKRAGFWVEQYEKAIDRAHREKAGGGPSSPP